MPWTVCVMADGHLRQELTPPGTCSWYDELTPECRILRDTIIFTIMKDLKLCGKYTVDFDEDWDHGIFCLVLSWYLNEPSMERVHQQKNKYQEVESVTEKGVYSPKKVQHCHDRTYVQFPSTKNTRFEVPFSPGSFYGEIDERKSFVSKKMAWKMVVVALIPNSRVEDYNGAFYRWKHPSFHYHVWKSIEDAKSIFVKIATVKGEKNKPKAFFLKILEMFYVLHLSDVAAARPCKLSIFPSFGPESI